MQINISIKTFNLMELLKIKNKIMDKGYILHIPIDSIILPINKKLYTTLKSPHVNKTAREQFLFQTYKSLLVLKFSHKFNIISQVKLKLFLNFIKSISSNTQIKIQYIT